MLCASFFDSRCRVFGRPFGESLVIVDLILMKLYHNVTWRTATIIHWRAVKNKESASAWPTNRIRGAGAATPAADDLESRRCLRSSSVLVYTNCRRSVIQRSLSPPLEGGISCQQCTRHVVASMSVFKRRLATLGGLFNKRSYLTATAQWPILLPTCCLTL